MNTQDKAWENAQKRKIKHLAFWTGLWVASMAFAVFGPKLLWDQLKFYSLIGIAINMGIGIKMIIANMQYINGLDELHKKIHMEAMAITLGVAVVFGLSFSLLDITNIIPFDAEISFLIMLIGVTYLVGVFVGNRKYK